MPLPKGYKHSEETKLKIAAASKGRFKLHDEGDIQRIINMYKDGRSACYIARLHGVDQKTLCSLLRRNEINMIKNRGARTGKCQSCHKSVSSQGLDKSLFKRGIWRCHECERNRGRSKNRLLKQQIIDAYGGKCVCCNECRYEFLSIDHVNGGGNQHRKKFGGNFHFYSWLKRHNFPRDEFRLLCYNCNMSTGFFGYCPHMAARNFGRHSTLYPISFLTAYL